MQPVHALPCRQPTWRATPPRRRILRRPLLRRFARVPALMQGKENRRVVGLYNRLAKALLEFEGLWLRAWRKGLDFALQGLHAPLIIRHPDSGAPVSPSLQAGWLGWSAPPACCRPEPGCLLIGTAERLSAAPLACSPAAPVGGLPTRGYA